MPMYPKINTLWKRDESGKVIFGSFSCKEFELINEWEVTEKIDGMNIAIRYVPGDESTEKYKLDFFGRTENAQIPTELMSTLQEKFTPASMDIAFPTAESEIFCFGEGYGPKIQSGGNYISKQSFILFDVVIRDKDNPSIKWWLSRDAVSRIAEKLEVQTVPVIGKMTCREIQEYVKSFPQSTIAERPVEMEGVVCRTDPVIHFRNGDPIMFKLKARDYR
jgi:hypothetical protein